MAPRERSKPSALSDEYVVDSSDDQAGPGSVQSQKAGAAPRVKQNSTAKPKELKRRKATSPSTKPSSRSQSLEEEDQDEEEEDEEEEDGEEEDEDEPQLADLLDENATQASRKPLSDKDRPKKKAKTMYVLCPIPVQALLTFKELLLSAQYQQSSMNHLQALFTILQ